MTDVVPIRSTHPERLVRAPPAARPDAAVLRRVLDRLQATDLVTAAERRQAAHLLHATHAFAATVAAATSIHLHIKVPDTARLPHDRLVTAGGATGSCCGGYVKYAMGGGINVICSSIPIRAEDVLPEAVPLSRPLLDHLGVDLRDASPTTRALFDAVSTRAAETGWRHVAQGGNGRGVFCCHTEVQAKHWVYAPDPRTHPPIEFALGDLVLHARAAGCDLRPLDPAHAAAGGAACCAKTPTDPAAACR